MDARMNDLRDIAERTLEACRKTERCAYYGEERELPVFVPAGDGKYPSFWVRDCAMCATSGLMASRDLRRYVEYVALCGQNGADERRLSHGLSVPPYAVADHINLNGRAVFFPGTYADGDDQGAGDYGLLPPLDDNYWFILMAAQYVRQSGERAILDAVYCGMTLAERLKRAWEAYCVDEDGLCACRGERWAVDWGFCDSIRKSGRLLMPSLLRRQAALALFELGLPGDWQAHANAISRGIATRLADPETGWLWSADGLCRQHDVWATAGAAAWGALRGDTLRRARAALADGLRTGAVAVDGYVRQLPLTDSPNCWESRGPGEEYQNGGYWSTPVGWYAEALWESEPELACGLIDAFIAHTRRFAAQGAPFEWIDATTTRFSGRLYGTSAALPLEGCTRAMAARGSNP